MEVRVKLGSDQQVNLPIKIIFFFKSTSTLSVFKGMDFLLLRNTLPQLNRVYNDDERHTTA